MSEGNAQSERPIEAIILAAGKGTRMNSDLAKVLHPVAGRAMVHWVLDACDAVGSRRNVVIIGHQADAVRSELADHDHVAYAEQIEQLGTGHAVQMAAELYADVDPNTDVLVLCGDGPLIRADTLTQLLERHRATGASATLATAIIDDPVGYGRIVRNEDGEFRAIVEQKDASDDERAIREINPSYYCFRAGDLFDALSRVTNDNANGEYYVTDVPALLLSDSKRVAVIDAVPAEDVLSINTPEHLAEVDRILRTRLSEGAAT